MDKTSLANFFFPVSANNLLIPLAVNLSTVEAVLAAVAIPLPATPTPLANRELPPEKTAGITIPPTSPIVAAFSFLSRLSLNASSKPKALPTWSDKPKVKEDNAASPPACQGESPYFF